MFTDIDELIKVYQEKEVVGEQHKIKVYQNGDYDIPVNTEGSTGVYNINYSVGGIRHSVYIGQSVNIGNRLREHSDKIKYIIEKEGSNEVNIGVEVFKVPQEGALMLEPILINKYNPILNKQFKRDKGVGGKVKAFAETNSNRDVMITPEGEEIERGTVVPVVEGGAYKLKLRLVKTSVKKGPYGLFVIYFLEDTAGQTNIYTEGYAKHLSNDFPEKEWCLYNVILGEQSVYRGEKQRQLVEIEIIEEVSE